jgi:hypothetical protein
MNKEKINAIVGSYLRAAITAVVALYMAGVTDPKALGSAALAAVLAPLAKALDKTSKDYGRGAKK